MKNQLLSDFEENWVTPDIRWNDTRSMWEVLVPTHSNNNEKYPESHHYKWDEFVRNISWWLTINKVAKWQWLSENHTLYKEYMIPVRIACTKQQIHEIIDFTNNHYKQEAVCATRISDEVIIKSNLNL